MSDPLKELSSEEEDEYGEEELDIIQDNGDDEEGEDQMDDQSDQFGIASSEQQNDSKASSLANRAKSAHPGRKRSPGTKSVAIHDLVKDNESYRLRPSTAVRI
jgi:hypothetical protein